MMKYISNYKNVKQSDALDNAIRSNCEKLDKYFNKEQKKNYLKYIQYEKIH